ncbi:MAG: hypothetical protein A2017_07720 [Lentisphaerae bacterium GWF2_44_16]|nr:MAG: hypothetical protein A2017_07720 [Lentisphaerae bacterium GWF2_44_16]
MLDLELYKKISAARKKMNSKVSEFLSSAAVLRAGRYLRLIDKNGSFISDDEEDIKRVIYFSNCELKTDGKSAADLALEADIGENEFEKEYLKGLVRAFSSLFEVVDVNRKGACITCRDLLNSEKREYEVTDIGFSKTAKISNLIFNIIIPVYGGFISNGIVFSFQSEYKNAIMKEYNSIENRGVSSHSPKRFRLFLYLNRKMGTPVIYE